MKLTHILLLTSICLIGASCQSTSSDLPPISKIKPTASKEGSLANQKLKSDALAGCLEVMKSRGYTQESLPSPLAFVIQKPVGKTGSKAWREMWIFNNINIDDNNLIMTFREDGQGSASFEIQSM